MECARTNIVVFDALDTIQGYAGARLGKSKPFYQQRIAQRAGMTRDELLSRVPLEEQLHMAYDAIAAGDLEPVPLSGAIELLEYVHASGRTPVIVTADIPQAATLTCAPFTQSGLVRYEHVAAMHHIGKKESPETWSRTKEIWFPKSIVEAVFEDGATYVCAAALAFDAQGYLVRFEPDENAPSNAIVGTPETLLPQLRRRSR
jgi:hypothetical protein